MTPGQLSKAISSRRLQIVVLIGGHPHWTRATTAREEDGWLYVAGEPIPHSGDSPWGQEHPISAWLWSPGVGAVSERVQIDAPHVGPGQALLVALGLRLHADEATATVQDVEEKSCRWATTPGPCEHGCPIPLRYPCVSAQPMTEEGEQPK